MISIVQNKFYSTDHIAANVIDIYYMFVDLKILNYRVICEKLYSEILMLFVGKTRMTASIAAN